jgi:signal transduction histidine kinase
MSAPINAKRVPPFFPRLVDAFPGGVAYLDSSLGFAFCNDVQAAYFGRTSESMMGVGLHDVVPNNPDFWSAVDRVLLTGEPYSQAALSVTWSDRPDQGEQHFIVSYVADLDRRGRVRGVFMTSLEVTQAILGEREAARGLLERNARLEEIVREMSLISAGVANDLAQGVAPADLRRRLNFTQNDEIGAVGRAFDIMAQALEDRSAALEVTAEALRIEAGVRAEVERKLQLAHDELEATVEMRTAELRRSNAELEQFAYVASHDLQEPLRMVSNYTQLLARRYRGRLDDNADDFIGFAVEGASRMQQLINDLLEFSRVGSKGQDLSAVAMELVMERTLFNLDALLKETGAQVEHGPLPMVSGDEVQLTQLLQNLIANAIKFRRAETPRIQVSAELIDGAWTVSVSDNGIGIDPSYGERIFVIFQRLHTRDDYPGTGIGLAVCKRIVERHGGTIWVESKIGAGATFRFTLRATEAEAARSLLLAGERVA